MKEKLDELKKKAQVFSEDAASKTQKASKDIVSELRINTVRAGTVLFELLDRAADKLADHLEEKYGDELSQIMNEDEEMGDFFDFEDEDDRYEDGEE